MSNITNSKNNSYQHATNTTSEFDAYEDLSYETINDLVDNPETLRNLATEILSDMGITEYDDALIEDIETLIKTQAQITEHQKDPAAFLADILTIMQEISQDGILSEDEIETEIIANAQQAIHNNSPHNNDNLPSLLESVLISLADENGRLNSEDDNIMLSDLFGISPLLASEIIESTNGDINQIMNIVSNSSAMD